MVYRLSEFGLSITSFELLSVYILSDNKTKFVIKIKSFPSLHIL